MLDALEGRLDAVWCGVDGAEGDRHADALTIAAGLAGAIGAAFTGVVADVGVGRHPAVLARDLLTLDALTHGRAALVLCDRARPGPEGAAGRRVDGAGAASLGLVRLAEAAAICRSMFAGSARPLRGQHFAIGSVNERLRSVHPEGPPILVDPVGGAGDPTIWSDVGRELEGLSLVLGSVDAMIVGGGPAEVVSARRALDAAAGEMGLDPRPALLWRVPLITPHPLLAAADGVILVVPDPGLASTEVMVDLVGQWSV